MRPAGTEQAKIWKWEAGASAAPGIEFGGWSLLREPEKSAFFAAKKTEFVNSERVDHNPKLSSLGRLLLVH
jgi:hypothetical protein